jgi:hypothetical protein
MKYLRKFFESFNLDSVKDLCETRLAYLLDEGFDVDIEYLPACYVSVGGNTHKRYENVVVVRFNKLSNTEQQLYDIYSNREVFEWEEIKDHFIPFLQTVKNTYKLGYTEFGDKPHLKGELIVISSIDITYLSSIDSAIEKEWLPTYDIKEIQFIITSFVK